MTVRVRPARPVLPIAAAVLILLGWWEVAHNSGAGWVQILGEAVFGLAVIGVLGPAVAVARGRLSIVACPADAEAGREVMMEVRSTGRMRVKVRWPRTRAAMVGPEGQVPVAFPFRGVYTELPVEIASAAPFGLQWWRRIETVVLPQAIHVAPARGTAHPLGQLDDRADGDGSSERRSEAGEMAGIRPYRLGDRRSQVHWPASAHAGDLMVRLRESPQATPVALRVTLPSDPQTAERIAGDALSTAVALLARGVPVVLETVEGAAMVRGDVRSTTAAGRRLARATGGGDHEPGITLEV